MKIKLIFLFVVGLTSLNSWAQVKFYSGDNEIKKADCSVNSVKAILTVPDEAKSYDAIEIGIRYVIPAHDNATDEALFSRIISKENLGSEVKFSLLNEEGTSDLTVGNGQSFNLTGFCTYEFRQDQLITFAVYLYGKTIEGYEWDKNSWGKPERRPVYKTTLIKKYDEAFTMDFGPVNPFVRSKNKIFSIPKYHPKQVSVSLSGDPVVDELSYHFGTEDIVNKSIFGLFRAYSSSERSAESIKLSVTKIFLRMANPEQSGFEKEEDFDMYTGTASNEYIYIPSMVVDADGYLKGESGENELENSFDFGAPSSSKPKKEGDRNKLIAKKMNELNWESKTIGNLDAEYLAIDFHQGYQVSKNDDGEISLNSGEKGKMSKLYVVVGEQGGNTFFGFIMQRGTTGEMSAEQKAFVDRMLKEFKVL